MIQSIFTMPKKTKPQKNRTLTKKQQKAFDNLVVSGGNRGDQKKALRDAGYSESIAKTPSKVFGSPTFSQLLEKAGVSDKKVAGKYASLLNSSRVEKEYLDGWREGRKWVYPSPALVRKMIEGDEDHPTGCVVMHIATDSNQRRLIVTYRHPDNAAQKGIVELIGKVRSHFAPDRLDVVHHDLSEEDLKALSNINQDE